MNNSRNHPYKPNAIDVLLEGAESGDKLFGNERRVLRTYLKNTLCGAGNSELRPDVQERISRIRSALNIKLPRKEAYANDVIREFNRILKDAPISANVMRFSSFLDPNDIPFFMLEAAAAEIPGLAELLEESDDVCAAILSVLEPLEKGGLVTINRDNEGYSTTAQIQEAIKEKDHS